MASVSPPTIEEFLRRFPEFNEADEYQIEAANISKTTTIAVLFLNPFN